MCEIIERNRSEARAEGKIIALIQLVKNLLSITDAANEAGMSEAS